jgi:hypothetical protein
MSVDPRLPASWQLARSVAAGLDSGGDPRSEHAALTRVVHEGEVIGMLVAATRHPLPAGEHAQGVAEIARTAGAWLGPVATTTRNRERRRADLMRNASDLTAVFQPIVDLETGRPVGHESLTRFQDGVSPAARFAEAVTLGIGSRIGVVPAGGRPAQPAPRHRESIVDADPARQALVAALHHYMLQTGAHLIAEGSGERCG